MVDPRTPPAAARRALDVLMDRLHEPWSVGRLARTLGLSSRTLYRAVRREFGASPMSLLREARLAEARFTLEAPEPGTTVTSIALDCGFTHLGRFASAYQKRFGELPSDTLRRATLGDLRRSPAPGPEAALSSSRRGTGSDAGAHAPWARGVAWHPGATTKVAPRPGSGETEAWSLVPVAGSG